MKYLISCLLPAMLFVCIDLYAGVPGKVSGTTVNIRSGADIKSPIVGKIAKDETVNVLAKKDNWLQIAAPESVKIYISEALVSDGKVIRGVNMRAAMSDKAPTLGELPAGTQVKLLDERSYGWVRIAPPETLTVYVAAMYVDFDEKALAVEEKKPEAKSVAPAAEVPATPAEADKPAAPVAVVPDAAVDNK